MIVRTSRLLIHFIIFPLKFFSVSSKFYWRYIMKNNRGPEEKKPNPRRGITRRRFLKTMGSGAAIAATQDALTRVSTAEAEVIRPEAIVKVNLFINGFRRHLSVEPRWSLLYVLRENFGLTGTKVGCERGECGACTVLIDGMPRYACMTLAVEAEGAQITTLEGLMDGEKLGPVQQAFLEDDALQCGYCTPGQIMSAEGLLRRNPAPDQDEIRVEMSGNLCRCGAYDHIFKAVGHAAKLKRGK